MWTYIQFKLKKYTLPKHNTKFILYHQSSTPECNTNNNKIAELYRDLSDKLMLKIQSQRHKSIHICLSNLVKCSNSKTGKV